jgi:hypothetical protein
LRAADAGFGIFVKEMVGGDRVFDTKIYFTVAGNFWHPGCVGV